jgi:DNA-binding NtrC family response regulator
MGQQAAVKLERAPASSCPRILLAEDDTAMRWLLAQKLRRAGFAVEEVRSGHEALDRLARALLGECAAFDLILSDLRMPGYSGLDLLASLRHLDSRLPVILITAFGTQAIHEAALRLGACSMLDKPFDLDDLVTLVSSATATVKPGTEEGQT